MRKGILCSGIIFLCVVVFASEPLTHPDWATFPSRKAALPLDTADEPLAQAGATVMKVVPHLSANEIWKSTIMIRSDATYYIEIIIEFRDPDGFPATVVFYDSDDEMFSGEGFHFGLEPYEIYSIDFDQIEGGWSSLQMFSYSSDSDRFYSIESVYNRYDENSLKTASVGVPTEAPYQRFIMNLDERFDAYSGYQKFRGLALTNTTDHTCRCDVFLYDDGKGGENLDGHLGEVNITLPPRAKWLGYAIDLYPDIDEQLRHGFGYMDVICDELVSALGLGFESESPVAASVPIDPLQ